MTAPMTKDELARVLEAHRAWLSGEPEGAEAYLAGANLTEAYLAEAYLAGAIGNMREIKSVNVEVYAAVWYVDESGAQVLQIGCQKQPVNWWKEVSVEDLSRFHGSMAGRAWSRLGPLLLALVEASPAVPWKLPEEVQG